MAEKEDPSTSKADLAEEKAVECGIGPVKPRWMRRFADVRCMVAMICIFNFLTSSIHFGFLNGALTTIEKQFGISSYQSGLIKSCKEIGELCIVLFVAYLGGKGHRPIVLGATILLTGVGMAMLAIPHYLLDPYDYGNNQGNGTLGAGLCPAPINGSVADPICLAGSGTGSSSETLIYFMYFGMALSGFGPSAFTTIGISYMDDHTPNKTSPLYYGIIYACGSAAAALGYVVSSVLLSFFVDFDRVDSASVTINPYDSRWIGAWWLGFLCVGVPLVIVSFPFFCFPKSLPVPDEEEEEDGHEKNVKQEPQSGDDPGIIKGIFVQGWSLLTNAVYMTMLCASIFTVALLQGFTLYTPKLVEVNFGLTASAASLYTGAICVPGNIAGVLIGGLITRRWKLRGAKCMKFVTICSILGSALGALMWITPCDSSSVASGVEQSCPSRGCACSDNNPIPVCGADGTTHYSACVAGCQGLQLLNGTAFPTYNYTDCECLQSGTWALQGRCITPCPQWRFILFMASAFCLTFLSGMQISPSYQVYIRSVKVEEKSFALGIRHLLQRLLSNIPAPVYFGAVIDAACTMWQRSCGSRKSCWVYDRRQFAYGYLGLMYGLSGGVLIFWVATWVVLSYQWKKTKKAKIQAANGIAGPYSVDDDETRL
ncbi:SLCO5A1 [Branchiostoma lanceolatum]|uniref:Solute carrier organic anion transporter family member n=1 Tax=Branchiostoma lanceolatum TaxID=7740 RepID=A0A8J9ZDT0_BRALA|nr:SLCO5A1 [Branchiostoma lanceolatum]